MKKIKLTTILIVTTIITMILISTAYVFADGNKYKYTKKSILNNTHEKKIYDTNSADYIFEYGLELLKGGMYEESISKFNELRVRFPRKILSKMSHIYEGISRVRMSSCYNSSKNTQEALSKYHYIIKDLPEFSRKPSEDLIIFYVSLSKNLRKFDMIDFSLLGYMEYSMIFFNDEIRDMLSTEIAYLHYLKGNFYSAVSVFSQSMSNESRMGLARSYSAVGEVDKAIKICEELKKKSSGKDLIEINKYCSYIKSLRNATPSGDPYAVNYEGHSITGNYKIFAGHSGEKNEAEKLRDKARLVTNGTNFTINLTRDGETFSISSVNVMNYSDAKDVMEKLIKNGYDNAFIKDISF